MTTTTGSLSSVLSSTVSSALSGTTSSLVSGALSSSTHTFGKIDQSQFEFEILVLYKFSRLMTDGWHSCDIYFQSWSIDSISYYGYLCCKYFKRNKQLG